MRRWINFAERYTTPRERQCERNIWSKRVTDRRFGSLIRRSRSSASTPPKTWRLWSKRFTLCTTGSMRCATSMVEARYRSQVWELDTPLPVKRFHTAKDVAALVEAFHAVHDRVYAVRDEHGRSALQIAGLGA